MVEAEKGLIWEAREIVRSQPRSEKTQHLAALADELAAHYDVLKRNCTRGNIATFTATVTRVCVIINSITAAAPTPPHEGAGVIEKQQIAA